jgi:hypothetical protein
MLRVFCVESAIGDLTGHQLFLALTCGTRELWCPYSQVEEEYMDIRI